MVSHICYALNISRKKKLRVKLEPSCMHSIRFMFIFIPTNTIWSVKNKSKALLSLLCQNGWRPLI